MVPIIISIMIIILWHLEFFFAYYNKNHDSTLRIKRSKLMLCSTYVVFNPAFFWLKKLNAEKLCSCILYPYVEKEVKWCYRLFLKHDQG